MPSRIALLIIFLCLPPALIQAQHIYQLSELGSLPGLASSEANSINNAGQIVGTSYVPTGTVLIARPTLWQGGKIYDLGLLGGDFGAALKINADGAVIGTSQLRSGDLTRRGFVWTPSSVNQPTGAMKAINTANALLAVANGINSTGFIVGDSLPAPGFFQAFSFSNEIVSPLNAINGLSTFAKDVNDFDFIVGSAQLSTSSNLTAIYWQNNQARYLAFPGSGNSEALAINYRGWVVGYNNSRPVLWKNGRMLDVNLPGENGTENYLGVAKSINTAGEIVGYYERNGQRRAFLNSNGRATDLTDWFPLANGLVFTSANSINDAGQIVGTMTVPINGISVNRAFLLSPVNRATAVNAANYRHTLAPESLVSIFGNNLANTTVAVTDFPLPKLIENTSVRVNGVPAELLFISPSQINFLLPRIVTETALIEVYFTNRIVSFGLVANEQVSPAIFTFSQDGRGVPVAQTTSDGNIYLPVYNADGRAKQIDAGTAAKPNYLVLYATGVRWYLDKTTATIGGLAAPVEYAGDQKYFAGLDQINIKIPPELKGHGEVEVVVTSDGRPANKVKINFQ